ncbi:MAG: hypothetical protein AAF630_06080 [Cyanobacteria bacterium P01_C01_bin.38]
MRNIDRKKLDRETINILYGNSHRHLYEMWEYDISSLDFGNKKNTTQLNNRFTGNEIFASCLIGLLLSISFGGSYLIRNRTQQKSIYNSIPQVSSNIRQ